MASPRRPPSRETSQRPDGNPPASPEEHGPSGGGIDLGQLRAVILHLVGVAAAYEVNGDTHRDTTSDELLRDVVKRTRRHMKAVGLKHMMAGSAIIYEILHKMYRRYWQDDSITQEILAQQVTELVGGSLSPDQLVRAAPTRDMMKEAGGPAAMAKSVIAVNMAGVTDRQFHTWCQRARALSGPEAFGNELGAPGVVEYLIRIAIEDLRTVTGAVLEHEAILGETLVALEKAESGSNARIAAELSKPRRGRLASGAPSPPVATALASTPTSEYRPRKKKIQKKSRHMK